MATKNKSSEKIRPMLSSPKGYGRKSTFHDIESFAKKWGPLLFAISFINEWRRKASQVKRSGQCYHPPKDMDGKAHFMTLSHLQKNGVPCYSQFHSSMNGDEKQVK